MKILEEVAASPNGARLQDLAEAIECSAPAALNLVKTLVDLGYLQRQEKPARYVIGGKVNELARVQSGKEYVGQIKHAMSELVRRFPGMSVYHCVLKGSEVVIERHIDAGTSGVVREGSDYVLPAYTSLGSMTHLAFWPEALRAQYINRHPFDVYGIAFWNSQENFEAALERIRKEGVYHVDPKKREYVGIGVPVFTTGKSICASMTLSWSPAEQEEVDFDIKRQEIAKAAKEIISTVNQY